MIRLWQGIFLMVMALVLVVPTIALAQSANNLEPLLEKVMAPQPPLTEDDVKIYLNNVDTIYRLRLNPDYQPEALKTIGVWTDERFAYVTTKMAVGLSILLKPGETRNAGVPAFAKPTAAEEALIKRYQDELAKAMEAAQAKYTPATTP